MTEQQGKQLERPQRADHAAHRDGAVLRLGAAARRRRQHTWRWVAFALFVLAMITDKVDGDLARKHNLITNFGKIADPIADKAMTGMAFIGLAIIHDFLPAGCGGRSPSWCWSASGR